MSVGFVIKFLGTVMDLLIPWILAHLIDDIVPQKNVPLVFLWGAMMLICSLVAVFANIVANRMASKVAAETTRKLRHDLFGKIAWLSCRQIDDFTIPSLISRLTSDTYNIHQMIGMMQRLGVRAPIILLGGIALTLTLDPVLTLVLVCVLPFMAVVVYLVSKKGIPLYGLLQQTVDKLVRVVRENITGIRVIKALSKTEYEKSRFSGVNAETVRNETKAGTVMALSNPLMNLFLNLGLTAVILAGAYRVNGGLSQPGKIIAFMTYFTIILNAMLSITRIFMLISRGHASFLRIRGVLDAPEDLTLHAPDVVESGYHITFEHVSFSYHKKQNNLSDISFALGQGETLGIIGTTGSGKSSVIKLLMRFYDADEGVIRINGRNVNCIPFDELYKMFGIVFQNDVLFADTIAENIDLGRGLPAEEIRRSTALAQAGEFIESLSDGWEHELTARGSNLSGGQKQRILISRALAGNPEILILDDSSSALDYKTDALLRRSLRRNYRSATAIIVAQRISSIMHADHILVLDDGRCIGCGTHEELMERCESYREIARSQMGGRRDA
jgi:ATP-binding cassette subfamily B protein